jgi:orotidine-5'-phosphate decarboxylase
MDVPTMLDALAIEDKIAAAKVPHWVKIGMQLFTAAGPAVVREMKARGAKIFLDLKFFDIPNTVSGAAQSAAALGVEMFNVHAQGGEDMMKAAVAGAKKGVIGTAEPPLIIAVTILTSQPATPEQVLALAKSAKASGMSGVVCSGKEAANNRRELGEDFRLVCPGIRLAGADKGDQVRVVTPSMAAEAGADFIVVGRDIIEASDVGGAAKRVYDELTLAV